MSDVTTKDNEKYSLLIAGYIRRLSNVLEMDIPKEICFVIDDFYPKIDLWDMQFIDSSRFDVDEETQTLKCIAYDRWNSAFGTSRIRPIDYKTF